MARKPKQERPKKPPLFNRPMTELREAFVRSRFAEQACFWRADIEQWLAREREAELPEHELVTYASPWYALLARDDTAISILGGQELAQLQKLATPTPPPLVSTLWGSEHIPGLLAMIDAARVDAYDGYPNGPLAILVPKSDDVRPYRVFVCNVRDRDTPKETVVLRPYLVPDDVMRAILSEWMSRRPKWREARQFLCAALSLDIRVQRELAVSDFDEAVSVSDDGTKIVRADWVVTTNRPVQEIWSTRNTDRRFTPEEVIWIPKARFSKKSGMKVRLAREDARRRMNALWASDVLRDAHSHDMTQFVFRCVYGSVTDGQQILLETPDGEKILVTAPMLVPPELLSAASGR